MSFVRVEHRMKGLATLAFKALLDEYDFPKQFWVYSSITDGILRKLGYDSIHTYDLAWLYARLQKLTGRNN